MPKAQPKFYQINCNIQKMKNLVLFLSLIALLTGCSKDTVEKPLSDQVSGEYEASAIIISGTPLPLPFQSGNSKISVAITVARLTDVSIKMKVVLTEVNNGKTTLEEETIDNIQLVKSGGVITMSVSGVKIGTVENDSLIYGSVVKGVEATLKAEKK